MSFESDLHRSVLTTWCVRLVGRALGASLAVGVVVAIALAVVFGEDEYGVVVGLACIASSLAFIFYLQGATAPMPDPDDYDLDE